MPGARNQFRPRQGRGTVRGGRGWLQHVAVAVVVAILPAAQLTPGAKAEPIFTEMSAQLGVRFHHFIGATGEYYFPEINGAGLALLDYDGDGDLDLYINQGAMLETDTLPSESIFPPPEGQSLCDQLFRNDLFVDSDGTPRPRFVPVTESSGIRACGFGTGVATGDYNNDGAIDLYISQFGPNMFWRNNGDGTFTNVTQETGTDDPRWTVPAIFMDYDRDGWLDLYVGNYADFRLTNHKDCFAQAGYRDYCGPRSYRPEPDRLFRNRRDGTFEDVTLKAGLQREYGYALGAISGDFNGDGWIDLYVANDGVANQLWVNGRDGTFFNDALLAGCAVNAQGQPEASMGVDAGYFDGDGDLDIFIAHLVNETNTLYVNDGSGIFEDRSSSSGLGAGSWKYTGFGTSFFDYDNDGWLDLLIVNGGVTVVEELVQQRDPFPFHQPNQLFRNLGDGRFEEATDQAGPAFVQSEVSRGAAFGDIDNDGDTDVAVHNDSGPLQIFINNSGRDRSWINLRLLDPEGRRDMLGSVARVLRTESPDLSRQVRVAGSYASSNDPRVLIGLGEDEKIDEVLIHWSDGTRHRRLRPPARQFIVLRGGKPGRAAPEGP